MRKLQAALKKTLIFSGLEEHELANLVARMKRESFARGETVFREGEEGEDLYVILKGTIRTSMLLADGKELFIANIEKGNFFGDMAIIENAPRSATCTALEPCDLLSLSRKDFYDIIHLYPNMALKILDHMLSTLASRFKDAGAALSEMVRWGEDARKKATTDKVTGLFNRRFFDESFNTCISRARGAGKPMSFVMIDMDRFGTLNKKYGEAAGDQVILAAVKVFKESFREKDILARYGGDEFSFILPDTDSRAAKKLCENMADRLRQIRISACPDEVITLSIGIAAVPEAAETPADLKEAADNAVYAAKEGGRDRIEIAPKKETGRTPEVKTEIHSIAEKRRVAQNITEEIFSKNSFLLLGHRNPDADCIASLVAFALLLSKFHKEVTIFLIDPVIEQLGYLLEICKYNSIKVVQDIQTDVAANVSAVVILDTPKPEMIMSNISVARILADLTVRKIEIDHHLGADAHYAGDPGFRLVSNASSTCELIGYLSLKLSKNPKVRLENPEIFSRNLSLAILTGIVGDSQMGKYLKTNRERWYYRVFSEIFDKLLAAKTKKGGRNLSSMEDIFDVINNFSRQEKECYEIMKTHLRESQGIHSIILGKKDSKDLFSRYEEEIIVNVSKSAADDLSEASGKLGMVAYYDAPRLSDYIQFRLRRSASYTDFDLRQAIVQLGVTNGGGHPGAVGFRVKKSEIADIHAYGKDLVRRIEELLAAAEKNPPG
ncbi:MAG: diguanylate cyclase [Spirochaetaceae bacterium]|nr:diguanylate cyclase [Spirochaetaceae bacterium]